MVSIPITPEAFEAIRATLPQRAAGRGPDGLIRIWLDRKLADEIGRLRGSGESYSEVILRVAKASNRAGDHKKRPVAAKSTGRLRHRKQTGYGWGT